MCDEAKPMQRLTVATLALTVTTLVACRPQQPAGASTSQVPNVTIPQVSYVLRAPEGPVPSLAVSYVQSAVRNPLDGNQGAIEEGRFLYVRMNCAYCHAFDGTGGMGPDLTDQRWRYGASDADIFNSIFRGRAQGMPAWGGMLPEQQIWELVAYVRSLGGANPTRYHAVRSGHPDVTRKTAVNASDY
jgi:cytochrome c oxidase cbb3-type subunit III